MKHMKVLRIFFAYSFRFLYILYNDREQESRKSSGRTRSGAHCSHLISI